MIATEYLSSESQEVERAEMAGVLSALYPICRSITGDGVRESLRLLQRYIPLRMCEVASGTRVFDWTVPNEWNIRDAYIKNAAGERMVDFGRQNLHVVSYSVPVHQVMSLAELRPHLFSSPEQPDIIPYRTSYYRPTWGFCLSEQELATWPEEDYEVCIDATLAPGSLTYGELLLPGTTEDEVLISCHCCHPSLANDNLSGMVLSTWLARTLLARPHRLSYRFLFIPGTIGSITWLATHAEVVPRIRHGLVVACVGDPGPLHYKRSRRGNAEIDQAVEHVLQHSGQPYTVLDFSPYGYDERQYCSPGFNLPMGSLTRTPHGRYPEYHTSADNLDFIRPEALESTLHAYLAVLDVLDHNVVYINTNPHCEPQLGRRGLYSQIGGRQEAKAIELAMPWVLNLADGDHTLLQIAQRAGLPFAMIYEAAELLRQHDLMKEMEE